MKTLVTLLLTLSSLTAFAGEIKIFDRPTWEYSQVIGFKPEFAINKELGRAWVNISFTEANDGPLTYDQRVQVQGMSYNSTTSQIQLDVDGVQIICANVKTNFFGTKIKPTGLCTFKQKYYIVKVDNGYEVEKIEKIKITLNY